MDAVSNTSPISNLAIIGRLDLLKFQFSRIIIPEAVFSELSSMPDREAFSRVQAALSSGWIERRSVGNPQSLAPLEAEILQAAGE